MQKDVFATRRHNLMKHIGEGIAIIPTAPVCTRNRDVEYPFRADSDFAYLTSFPEPEAVAVLAPGRSQGEFIMFCREKDPEKETWDGRRAGLEGACIDYGADDAFPIDDIDDILPGLLENRPEVHVPMGRYPDFNDRLMGWVGAVQRKARAGVHAPRRFVDLAEIVYELRLIKQTPELRALKKACSISARAHKRAMRACKPGLHEYQIEAELSYEFRHGGGQAPAYPPIVAGGANACILHYTENADPLRDGDLLLIDAGVEYDYYAADITRTFPVNGKYSAEQKELYEVVLAAQQAAIDVTRPGALWNEPHEAAVKVLAQGLLDARILKGSLDGVLESGSYKRFYMHRTGHWLGMDVHDVGEYKIEDTWRQLEPGMVMTVEPGLYIPENSIGVHPRWWNIGIRIEDDVVIKKKTGVEILSSATPKTVAEIEQWMAG